MFTLVRHSFLPPAQSWAIKEIWFFDMKENKSKSYSRKTKLYEEEIKLLNTMNVFHGRSAICRAAKKTAA